MLPPLKFSFQAEDVCSMKGVSSSMVKHRPKQQIHYTINHFRGSFKKQADNKKQTYTHAKWKTV